MFGFIVFFFKYKKNYRLESAEAIEYIPSWIATLEKVMTSPDTLSPVSTSEKVQNSHVLKRSL